MEGEDMIGANISSARFPLGTAHRAGAAPLESILEELSDRSSRPPDYPKQYRALVALASRFADASTNVLQALAEAIQDMTQCDSAGISLVINDGGTPHADGNRFYWAAIAGAWNPHVGGGTPREFGPCGDVLDQNRALLFRRFERRYRYLTLTPAAEECLALPFHAAGAAVGTIWAVMHSDRRQFDAEDGRVMASLAVFAALAYQSGSGSLERLAASTAHELTGPLTGIVANVSTCEHMLCAASPNVDGALATTRRTIRDASRACEVITRLRSLSGRLD
jgi:hypothetical protein